MTETPMGRVRWERDTRYYEALPEQDLFGNWVITLVWGRRGTRLGRMVRRPVGGPADIPAVQEVIAWRRQQRGYVRVR